MQMLGRPWWIETPWPQEGQPNLFMLPEYIDFRKRYNIELQKACQCNYTAAFTKATAFMANFPLELNGTCKHPMKAWAIPWSGQRFWSPHPPLMERQMAIPLARWRPWMLRRWEPKGPFLTRRTALYPQALNKHLTDAVTGATRNIPQSGILHRKT